MRMERLLHQFIQDYLMSTWSDCLLLVLVFALSIVLLFYRESSLEYFRGMPSPIPSLMSLWSLWRRPRLTCVDEVNSRNQCTSCQMFSSLFSPPSSSHAPRIKYDVFINFRGSDTRRGFLSHLLKALSRAKIEAYVDYKLREGDELSSALFTAIEESQITLIIFSKDYASSKWCLEELVKITECMMKNGQIVVPIFYNVDPSDVRHQKGCYKNVFAKHEKLFKGNTMEKWKTTLNKVADLSGFHSINFGTEAKLIEEVVRRVLTRLNQKYQVHLKGLIGIDKPIADLKPLICCAGSDVRIIGIWGMGGIGKTTIASVLYNMLSSEYEVCCFLANIRAEKSGITQLKSKLISILLEEKDLNIDIPNGVSGNILSRLRHTKALIVLDDVDDSDQVTNLIGGHDWLGSGSRIIVTTRDKHVIHKEADYIYEVKALGCDDALKLLNLHAFNIENHLQMNCWHKLMMKVVEYAKGLPLALKVLGSFLNGKSAEEWESQLQKFQKMPFPKIQAVLRLSYDGLDEEGKDIFLYIACFFNIDCEKYEVQALLDACGYSTSIALRNLQDKALIEVSRYKNISMHEMIREMGREIVREQNIKRPGERSHLCNPDDIYHVLKHDEGTERIESITLDISRVSDLRLNPQSFTRMVNLKLLRFYNSYPYGTHSGVHLPEEGLEILSNNLRLFHWDQYPSKSLPATFIPENLVELRMGESRVEKLWDDAPNLANLKEIDLWRSELVELPDFSNASSLELINLGWCVNLHSIHPSIFCLQRLRVLSLDHCVRLEELPDIEALPSSDRFCSTLCGLYLEGCKSLKHLPDSLSKLRSLEFLDLEDCIQLDTSNLQIILDGLSSLTCLYLDNCRNLFELPKSISKLPSLEQLSLQGTNIKNLPKGIKHLTNLEGLYLRNCRRLQSLPEQLPASLNTMSVAGCTSLERLFTPTPKLVEEHLRIKSERKLPKLTFSFYDCPNLDKDALDAVLEYVKCCNE